MKKIILFAVVFIFVTGANSQNDNFVYYGVHWEKNFTINSRLGWVNTDGGYLFCDIALPTLIAGVCGWHDFKNVPGGSFRFFSMRGSGRIIPLNNGLIGLDISGDMMNVYHHCDSVCPDSVGPTFVFPFHFGPSIVKSFGDRLNMVTCITWGWALSESREGDPVVVHKRIGIDSYWHYFLSDYFLFYSGIGYGYYPKGLPTTYPRNKAFGGLLLTIGIAF